MEDPGDVLMHEKEQLNHPTKYSMPPLVIVSATFACVRNSYFEHLVLLWCAKIAQGLNGKFLFSMLVVL